MTIIIREFLERDIPELKDLYSSLLDHHEKLDSVYYERSEDFDSEIENWLRGELVNPHTVIYIAELDEEIVGFIHLMVRYWPRWYKTRQVGFISYAFVRPDYRRQKVGRTLLETAQAWSRDKGFRYLELYVDNLNELGITVWTKYGFKDSKKYMVMDLTENQS